MPVVYNYLRLYQTYPENKATRVMWQLIGVLCFSILDTENTAFLFGSMDCRLITF